MMVQFEDVDKLRRKEREKYSPAQDPAKEVHWMRTPIQRM